MEQAWKVARKGSGLSLVPGIGVVELGEEEAEAIEEWQAFKRGETPDEWPRYMLLSLFTDPIGDLNLEGALEHWLGEVDQVGSRQWPTPDFLRDYQARGIHWLAGQCELGCHVLLADEMGLGKTLQVLGLIEARPLEEEAGRRPHLIVCPASVVPVWKNEIQRFYPKLRISILKTGHDFETVETDPGAIWLASYTQLRRHKHQLGKIQFGYSVLDEAQQIKNPDAKVSHACMQIQAAHRLALTGTPLENRQLDLWTLFRYLMPGLLGGRRRSEMKVAEDLTGEFRTHLGEQIRPFILRRTKGEVMQELPPKVEMDLSCPMTELQVNRYRSLTEEGLKEMGDNIDDAVSADSMHFFALLTRLRQVCCDPGLLPGDLCDTRNSGKIQSLLGKIEDILENDRKAVIFSQFTSFIDRIEEALSEQFPTTPLYQLTGKTRDRDRPVREFQERTGGAVILVSLRAGGVGITLHAADYVFLMDPWWNPAVEAQAVDRVHRMGQLNPVFVYRMITEGTIEERIQLLKNEKRDLFARVVGDLEGVRGIRESFQSLSQLVTLESEEIP
jgi:SNF2 family DNA or RNA helicase